MQLKSLKYHDRTWNWLLNQVDFTELTLLVGASGVGKTRIIEAIADLRRIALGQNRPGVVWEVEFSINEQSYRWSGEFDTAVDKFEVDILKEQLLIGEALWMDRVTSTRKFDTPYQSLIYLLRNDPEIRPVYRHFQAVMHDRWPTKTRQFKLTKGDVTTDEYPTSEAIQQLAEDNTLLKLWLADQNQLPVFEQIKADFSLIFPTVEDIQTTKVEVSPDNRIEFSLKEKCVEDWIPGERVSAGMFKVLMFITDMYLVPNDALILIDEFENSLGVNCIEIVDEMVSKRRQLQYIFTSHHPYIINDIPIPCWKIVTRKGNVVTAKSAEVYNLGNSKHTAFKQLLQLDEFEDGITR